MFFDEYGLHHMMNWDLDFWLILIFIGIVTFLVIVLIVFYSLRNGTNKLQGTEIASQQPNQKDLNSNKQLDKIKFCSECGAQLNTENILYCPTCGQKIL